MPNLSTSASSGEGAATSLYVSPSPFPSTALTALPTDCPVRVFSATVRMVVGSVSVGLDLSLNNGSLLPMLVLPVPAADHWLALSPFWARTYTS